MALTVTRDEFSNRGNKRVVYGTLTFDSSYVAGGLSLVARDLSLLSITRLIIDSPKGFDVGYDYVNQKVQAFAGAGSQVLSEQFSGAGVGNAADTTDDTLFTFSMPAKTLAVNGQSVRLNAYGSTAANGNNKRLRIVSGATVWATTGTITSNALPWWAYAILQRVDNTHVNVIAAIEVGLAIIVQTLTANSVVSALDANALALTVTGASLTTGAANDLLGNGFLLEEYATVGGGAGMEIAPGIDLSALKVTYVAEGI